MPRMDVAFDDGVKLEDAEPVRLRLCKAVKDEFLADVCVNGSSCGNASPASTISFQTAIMPSMSFSSYSRIVIGTSK